MYGKLPEKFPQSLQGGDDFLRETAIQGGADVGSFAARSTDTNGTTLPILFPLFDCPTSWMLAACGGSRRNWLEKYRQGGVDELLALMYQGKAPSLTDEQQEKLAKHLDENTNLDQNSQSTIRLFGKLEVFQKNSLQPILRNLRGKFWLRAKASSDVERSSALNCAPLLAENFYQYQMT